MRELFQSIKATLFDKSWVKELFDHFRNLLIATLIIAAGGYAIGHATTIDVLGVVYEEFAGYLVLAIGALLAVLTALNGIHQINKQQWHIGIRLVLIVLYVVGIARLIQLVVALRTG